MTETEKFFEIISKFTIDNRKLINFGIVIGLLAIAFVSVSYQIPVIGEKENVSYINASFINSSGFSETGTFNISTGAFNQSTPLFAISEMNNQSFYGNETNANPWSINITFTNVTKFNYVDLTSRYFSTSGTPSAHEVELMIWCPTHNNWIELKDYHNEDHWYGRQYVTIDSEHYISVNRTVLIQILHSSNGINTHVMWIDVARLIYQRY